MCLSRARQWLRASSHVAAEQRLIVCCCCRTISLGEGRSWQSRTGCPLADGFCRVCVQLHTTKQPYPVPTCRRSPRRLRSLEACVWSGHCGFSSLGFTSPECSPEIIIFYNFSNTFSCLSSCFSWPSCNTSFFFNISSHKEVSLALLNSFCFYLSLKLFSDCNSTQYFPGLQSRITYSSCGNHRLIDLHSVAKAAWQGCMR